MSRLFYQPERHAGQRSATTLPPVRHTTLVRRLLVPTLAVGLVLVAIAWLVVMQPGLWATVAVLLVGLALAMRQGVVRREASVMVLTVAVGVSTVNYMAWRAGLINWGSWWVAVPLFLAEVLGALHALGLQYTVWPRKEPLLNPTSDPTRLPVYIFIPTVNEGVAVLEPTIRGALAARERYLTAHPHARVEIVICNDGRVANAANWQETERLAERLGVTCITRTVGGGAKAGNIEHARQQVGATGAALLVIFDADQVAEPEFLLKTVPPFADTSIGWVQTGQYYGNLENPVARWAHDQQALFYRVLCPGKAAQNAAFICGTNVVLRAAALDEIGGLPQSSVTEDFMASIELHPRWRSMFVREQLATGLGPMDLHSYFNQQRRWAIGTLSVLRSHWRQIFLPWVGGLSPAQRLQYALACTHYLCGVRDLVYLVAPLVFIFVGVPAVQGATLGDFFWHFLPYWLMAQVAFWWVVWGRSSMRGIVIGFGSFPVLVGSLFTVLTGRRVGFSVTAKQRGNSNSLGQLWPHMLGLAACLVGIGYAFWLGISSGPMLVSVIWVAYTAALLGGVLWLGAADAGLLRGAARPRPTGAPVRPFRLKRLPLALGGGVVATTLIACLAAPAMLHTPAQPFTLAVDGGRPRLGLALPQELVQSRPAELEQQLGQQFAVVGRTQTIGDHFDQPWASQLQASGGRPWLTLLFGSPADDPINASLPAIANGLHDEALRRWANDIRTYGGPVYLSILPHVDRNWSLSSAVANGGIPQDAPRAWSHVRQIFAEAGANNVAWVWAAADPANDARYAPAADQIDAVLLSLISFPDTDWADPTTALRAAVERYPSKPLFVEVSAAGEAERKANWLREVGAAIATTPNVYAFLYHEGGPTNQNGTLNADQQAWSLASSPQVLAAMRDAINQAGVGQQAQPAGANQ